MLRGSILRWLVIAAFFLAVRYSPQFEGMPWMFDGWVSLPFHNHPILYNLPFIALGITLFAELSGTWLPLRSLVLRRRRVLAVALVVLAIPLLWTFRVRGWLGDLNNIDKAHDLPPTMVEPAEPLGALTYYYAMVSAKHFAVPNSIPLHLMTILFAATGVGAIFLWAELISEQWMLVFLMILSTGVIVLLCGYPEKGTPKSIPLICWYLYAGTRALRRQRGWDHISTAFLSLATAFHGSAMTLLPAHAWFVWREAGWRRALVGMLLYVAPLWLIFEGVRTKTLSFRGTAAGNIAAPTFWLKSLCISNCGYDFISPQHFVDIVNCLLTLAPVAVLCLPEAIFHARGSIERWLLLGTCGCIFLSIVWFPTFGYRADWDIFVITPLLMAYFTIQVATRYMAPCNFSRLAAAWIACSALHSFAWWKYFYPGIG